MNDNLTGMSLTTFVSSTGLLLRRVRRPFPTSSVNWLCSISPGESGRGAWDLDDTPNRSYTKRSSRNNPSPRGDEQQERPRRNQQNRYPNRDHGRDFPDRRGRESNGGYRQDRNSYREREQSSFQDSRHWGSDRERDFANRSELAPDRGYRNDRRNYRERNESSFQRRDSQKFNREPQPYEGSGRCNDYNGGQAQWAGRRGSRQEYMEYDEPSVVQKALAAEDDDLLYGVTPILLALLAGRRRRFETLYVQDGRGANKGADATGPSKKADNDAAFERILTLATGKQIEVIRLDKGDLNMLSRNRPHQGLVLQTSKLDYEDLKTLPKVEESTVNSRGVPPCYLVLDEVTDPQNAGALLRSAHFLGADGVIACRRNSCRLTPVVSKASAGALEMMRVQGIASMPRFLKSASENGWRVIGTALTKDAVNAKSISLDRPTLVVMGSEGHGLRTLVRNACDLLVRIEGSRDGDIAGELGIPYDPVDSLNVSVAGAVALYQLLGR